MSQMIQKWTETEMEINCQVLQIFESIHRQMVADKCIVYATPQQIIETIEKVRSKLKEQTGDNNDQDDS